MRFGTVNSFEGRFRVQLFGTIICVIAFAAGGTYSVAQRTTYQTVSIVSLVPRGDTPADTVRLVEASYVAYLASPTTAASSAASIGLDLNSVIDGTTIYSPPGTSNIEIRVTLPGAVSSAIIANDLAFKAVNRGKGNPLVFVEQSGTAIPQSAERLPHRGEQLAGAALLAILAGFVFRSIAAVRRRRADVGQSVS